MNVIIANKYKEMLMSLDIEVIKSIEGVFEVDEIVNNFSNFYFDRMILDITAIKDHENIDNLQKLSINLDMSKIILLLDDSEESTSRSYLSKLISIGIYNFTRNSDGIKYLLDNPNTYRDVAHLHLVNQDAENVSVSLDSSKRIIGVKSLTDGAGATTLIYLMKKQLEGSYNVCAIEVDKRDFTYFDDKEMFRCFADELPKELMKKRGYDVILVDLNNYSDDQICSEVLYLVEPSIVKLNKLLMKNRKIFENNRNRKIVLTKSFIKDSEMADFEYETKASVYYNLPCINDRLGSSYEVSGLLAKMGFAKQYNTEDDDNSNKGKLLGMFKF